MSCVLICVCICTCNFVYFEQLTGVEAKVEQLLLLDFSLACLVFESVFVFVFSSVFVFVSVFVF